MQDKIPPLCFKNAPTSGRYYCYCSWWDKLMLSISQSNFSKSSYYQLLGTRKWYFSQQTVNVNISIKIYSNAQHAQLLLLFLTQWKHAFKEICITLILVFIINSSCSYLCLFMFVCLPWVGRDCRLWHSCPDCAVDGPGTTPEMSASKGRSSGGSCCCCWVWKPWYWETEKVERTAPLIPSRLQSYLCILSPSVWLSLKLMRAVVPV